MAVSARQLEKARPRRIHYPSSDGKPMAESDLHADYMIYFREALKARFADRPDVYVAGNNLLYYVEGDPKKVVSPDVYVAFDIPRHPRDLYQVWKEGGKTPDVVFEFTSKTTRQEDVEKKLPLYRDVLQVKEYFRFDPTGDYLAPRLQGDRLVNGVYVPIPLVDGRMHSEVLNLDLVLDGDRLRLWDPMKQEWLLTPGEQAQALEAAEVEIARLRAELAVLKQGEE